MGRGNPRRGPPMVGVGRRVRFLCGGTKSPHAPRNAKRAHGYAMRPFRISCGGEAWGVVFGLVCCGIGGAFLCLA